MYDSYWPYFYIFLEVFLSLGFKRSKELINLFVKIETRLGYDSFKVLILYFCIVDLQFVNVFYPNVGRYIFYLILKLD
ncbi:hypothetical protein SAMN02983004_01013 [Borreliella japonica]|uniref:Uncharacterized protein n=1 Tax=Borreliella japonica TaxID=34095 RepID=A0A1G4QAW2_BORJA|nr:hypothetical protein SAMN02983004_01013 [Borreliella japonica]